MKAHLYRITCLTNLHVGSGDTNYNIIDNEVERDPVLDNVPIINGSGVKGALREHCRASLEFRENHLDLVFGKEDGKKPGKFKFLSANLLARPLRVSGGSVPVSYVLTTTTDILSNFKNLAEGLGYEGIQNINIPECGQKPIMTTAKDKICIEGKEAGKFRINECPYLKKLIYGDAKIDGETKDIIGIADSKFAANCTLPVLARNKLDNGESKNVWYEEIVPHKSVFYLFILIPTQSECNAAKEAFNQLVAKPGTFVQFGGNATIGEGYCKVEEVKDDE
jgi:CRISPR-associated protein Cmr4